MSGNPDVVFILQSDVDKQGTVPWRFVFGDGQRKLAA
jgi:hypothetical protein